MPAGASVGYLVGSEQVRQFDLSAARVGASPGPLEPDSEVGAAADSVTDPGARPLVALVGGLLVTAAMVGLISWRVRRRNGW